MGLGGYIAFIHTHTHTPSLVPPLYCTSAAWGGMDLDRNSEKALVLRIVRARAQSQLF